MTGQRQPKKRATTAKTQPSAASVADFLNGLADPAQRADSHALVEMMQAVTGAPPVLWGGSIVGFGSYRYQYASGHAGEWPLLGFSPRKQNLVLYLMPGFETQADALAALGPCKTGKSCLYLKSLQQVDAGALRALLTRSVAEMRARHGG